jgi:hypothetical protein
MSTYVKCDYITEKKHTERYRLYGLGALSISLRSLLERQSQQSHESLSATKMRSLTVSADQQAIKPIRLT